MNAFQPMIRNILEGKQLTDYHQKIKIVEKITKTNCGWPLYHYYIYMGQFPRKLPHGYIIKCYKNALRVNRYNFPTVNAIDFLFSTLHTTPFHYAETYFGALHQFLANATKSDTPWGSKPSHLQLGEF